MEEVWRDVVGYEKYYQISNLGNARSKDRVTHYKDGRVRTFYGTQLIPHYNRFNGYCHYMFSVNGQKTHYYVHRLVAEAFIDNPENKATVNHKDENKRNNCVTNLEWATQSENNAYNNLHARRIANTDIKERARRINFNAIAEKNKKPIAQLDKDGNVVKVWKGAIDAAKYFNTHPSNIRNVLYGIHETACGFTWKYATT